MKLPIDNYIYQSGTHKGKVNQKLVQTGRPKGTYRRNDEHPFVSSLFYLHSDSNKERWVTAKGLEDYQNKNKKWLRENRDRKAVWNKKWRNNNKKQESLYKKKWSENNKDRRAVNEAKRRAWKKKCLVELTSEQEGEIKQIYAHAGRVSKKLQIPFEVDHIIPLSKGGLHHPLNLQVVPARWNRRKHNKNKDTWVGL